MQAHPLDPFSLPLTDLPPSRQPAPQRVSWAHPVREATSDMSMSRQPSPPPQSYRLPLLYLLAMLVSVLTGRRRSFSADTRWLLGRLPIPPRIAGEENIPAQGPFVVVANHYQRPGLWVAWGVCLISMAVAPRRLESPEVRWAMAGEWRARPLGPLPWPAPFLRWLFRRVAATYGHIVVPSADFMLAGRAQAARAMLRALRPPVSGANPPPWGSSRRVATARTAPCGGPSAASAACCSTFAEGVSLCYRQPSARSAAP